MKRMIISLSFLTIKRYNLQYILSYNLFRDYFNGIESDDIGMSRPENVDISGTIVYKNWMRK